MKKMIFLVCAIGVIVLGMTEIVFTLTGLEFPRLATHVFRVLCIMNAVFLVMLAKKKG